MAGTRKLEIIIAGDAKGGQKALDSIGKSADDTSTKMGGVGKAAAAGFAIVGAAAVAGAGVAINAASDLAETVSKSNTIFGDAATGIEKWAGTAAGSIGQSKQQALDAAATFGNMFTQLGIGSKEAAGMSTSMVELASDFASFHNADITEVLAAQTAAFRGEYDAVQRFVPTINAAAVEQKALEMTGKATTKELTLQEKALATQALMMEGAGAATGDFERTQDGLANKQRIMSAQFADLTAKIGTALMPIMAALVDLVVTRVLPAFEAIGRWIADNQGIVIAFGAVIGTVLVAAFLSWAGSAAAAAAATVLAIAPVILITAAVAALVAGIVWAYQNFDLFRAIVDTVARFFTQTLWPALQTVAGFITGPLISAVGSIIGKFGELISKAGDTARTVVDKFGAIVSFFRDLPGKIGGFFSGLADMISRPFKVAFDAVKRWWNNTAGGFGFTTPSWIPFAGGKSFRIPEMHTGGIIPGGKGNEPIIRGQGGEGIFTPDQMAHLAPISSLIGRQSARSSGPTTLVFQVDGRTFAQLMVDNVLALGDEQGKQYLNVS